MPTKPKPKPCIYCLDGIGSTKDHIPPRGMSPTNPPNNLVTVPCCEGCRKKDAENDELVIDLFQSLAVSEAHNIVKAELIPERDRAWRAFPGKLARMKPFMVMHNGSYHFDFEHPILKRFFERVTMAVAYDAYKIPYARTVEFNWRGNVPHEQVFKNAKIKTIGSIFSYAVIPTPCATGIISRLNFYQGFTAFCMLSREEIKS